MTTLSRLTFSLEVKGNIFLQAFKFERRIEVPELQVDTLLETSSAKMETRNRTFGDTGSTMSACFLFGFLIIFFFGICRCEQTPVLVFHTTQRSC